MKRLLLVVLAPLAAMALPVVSVEGPVSFTGSFGTNQALTVGFSTVQDYANVRISAEINGLTTSQYTAYLTTDIGPGTTVADEFASTTQNLPGFGIPLTPIFTGLTLPAGTYYLTLFNSMDTSGGWSSTGAPVISTAPGASHNFSGYFITNDNPLPYPPAAAYVDLLEEAGRTLIYRVEAVPEPGTIGMVGLALAGAIAAMRRRSRVPRF